MGFPKLLCTESVKYGTGITIFWRSVPNIVLVLVLVTFRMVGKLLLAFECRIAGSAIEIIRFPRYLVFEVRLTQNSRGSSVTF